MGGSGDIDKAEDDLSAMAGVVNGLAIVFTIYSAIFVIWWMW